jgi:hypothetical protein
VRKGACIGAATILQPWTLRLILNAAALAAASPTLLFRPCWCVYSKTRRTLPPLAPLLKQPKRQFLCLHTKNMQTVFTSCLRCSHHFFGVHIVSCCTSRDPLRDEIREVGRGLSLTDTQTDRYVRLCSRRRLCARRSSRRTESSFDLVELRLRCSRHCSKTQLSLQLTRCTQTGI